MRSRHAYSLLVMQDEPHYSHGAEYRADANFGYFMNWVAAHVKRTTLAVPTARTCEPFGEPLDLPNVTFHELPYWHSLRSYLRLGRADRRTLAEAAGELVSRHDAVLVRLPSLPAAVFAREALRCGVTLVTYVGGNILTAANPLRSSNPLTRFAARMMARYVHIVTMRMVGKSDLTIAIGRELHDLCRRRNENTCQLITSLISRHDLFEREDSVKGSGPVTLFRAARLNPNKGTEYLLDAVGLLVRRGVDVRLRLAGGTDDEAYLRRLERRCAELGIEGRVDWLGHIRFGPELFELYRRSGIGVLSSISEGFPRFINEAWAFSLPVVATQLPGLCPPVEPEANAVLVAPQSAEALARGIQQVIDKPDLRRRLITGGMAIARDNTAEAQSQRVADMIAQAVRNKTGSRCADG